MIKKLIGDLTSSEIAVSAALKKCKAILSIHEDQELKNLINNELKGYKWDDVPDYRILTGLPKASCRRQFDGQIIEQKLHFSEINKIIGFDFNEVRIDKSIVEIESLINQQAQDRTGEICLLFTEEQLQLLWKWSNAKDNGWTIDSAWWMLPTNKFDDIYSRTQDILIDQLITINKAHPQLDKKLNYMKKENKKAKKMETHFHGNVTGSNLGIGENISQQDITIDYKEEIKEVIEKVEAMGFDKEDTADLEAILTEKKETGASVGKQLLSWVGKMSKKAIEKGIEHKIPELTDALSDYI